MNQLFVLVAFVLFVVRNSPAEEQRVLRVAADPNNLHTDIVAAILLVGARYQIPCHGVQVISVAHRMPNLGGTDGARDDKWW